MGLPDFSLSGKIALVIGAGSIRGIGREIALTFAEAGADVAISGFNTKSQGSDLDGTAQAISKFGRRTLAMRTDATKESEVTALVEAVVREFGTIDILVNNAGASAHETLLNTTEELWDKAMNINLKSTYLGCRAAAKIMTEKNTGNIINIASIGGLKTGSACVYGIAKAGVITLTEWIALELAPYNIRVNCLAPGPIDTDIGLNRIGRPPWEVANCQYEEMIRKCETPLGGKGKTSDVASAALFLASNASRFINGELIVIDGGMVLM
ncbi:MAG: SDR family oxidoreductase [Dehalococcoidales bacterium]|nr:MAG: SDR family oxidoreductase [Dehalococcoidales bacterium]